MGLFNFFKKKDASPKDIPFSEQRMLPRWKISTPAKIKWQDTKDYLPCEVRDLNMRGVSLMLAEKISANEVSFELYFNDKYFFHIEASVAWYQGVGGKHIYGLRFIRLRDTDREKIYQMMRDNFPKYLWKH